MALDSSVTASPAASSACCSAPRRNICGVWASHLSLRSTVWATRPSCSCFRVSGSLSASRPPTVSSQQASISPSICVAVTRQRAASCTSTQSWACAPCSCKAFRPFNTVWALVEPPQAATDTMAPYDSKNVSPADTTTKVPASRRTPRKAAKVCSTMGLPATDAYCLGPSARAREPLPAQGTSAHRRGVGAPDTERVWGGEPFIWVGHSKIEPIHGFT